MLQRRNRLMDRVFWRSNFNDDGFSTAERLSVEPQRSTDGMHLFGGVYHRLFLHSADVQLHLLKIEQQLNRAYRDRMDERDEEIEVL